MSASSALDEEAARFIEDLHVALSIASRDVRRVPSLSKAIAARVDRAMSVVTVVLERSGARQLLLDVAATRMVAVVFARPSTHRTLQLKGSDARIVDTPRDVAAWVAAHYEAFADEIVPQGYTREMALAVHRVTPSDPVAIAFTASDVFAQTPGPNAGERITGRR